jgi:hypothetical protein
MYFLALAKTFSPLVCKLIFVIFISLLEFGGASPKILICEARPRRITKIMDDT